LIADDQDEVRRTVAELLESTFHVIGMAEHGKRAIELASVLQPEVVVLDICMPVLDGIEAAEQLRKSGYPPKVVFQSMRDAPEFVEAALVTGALGYVLKSSVATELVSAIGQASEGRRFVSPALADYIRADTAEIALHQPTRLALEMTFSLQRSSQVASVGADTPHSGIGNSFV
jgi:DNA-binding NarL/FixJ family response regulator